MAILYSLYITDKQGANEMRKGKITDKIAETIASAKVGIKPYDLAILIEIALEKAGLHIVRKPVRGEK